MERPGSQAPHRHPTGPGPRAVGWAVLPAPCGAQPWRPPGPGSRACGAGEGCWLAHPHFLLASGLQAAAGTKGGLCLLLGLPGRPLPSLGPVGEPPAAGLQGLREHRHPGACPRLSSPPSPPVTTVHAGTSATTSLWVFPCLRLCRHFLSPGHGSWLSSPSPSVPRSPIACDTSHHPSTLMGQKEGALSSVQGRPPGSPEGRQGVDTLCLPAHTPTFWAQSYFSCHAFSEYHCVQQWAPERGHLAEGTGNQGHPPSHLPGGPAVLR